METAAPPSWYTDPQGPQALRYWDGASWTASTAPMPQPTPGSQSSDGLHWVVPVGRSWQSIAAGYLAFACLALAAVGPVGLVLGAVTLWLGIWGLRLARAGGHGSGRAIFGIVCGALAILAGALTTLLWLSVS